jgi:ATP-dependent DNA ligase
MTASLPKIQKASPMTTRDANLIGAQSDRWVVERKFDGHRILIHRTETGVRILTGGHVDKTGLLPHVEAAAIHLPEDTILDGEVCNCGDDQWGIVQAVLGSDSLRPGLYERLCFQAFDVLRLGGHDCISLPLADRRAVLKTAVVELIDDPTIQLVEQHPAQHLNLVYEAVVSHGGEGVIVKDLDAPYYPGARGKGWFKVKHCETTDLVVTGVNPGEGRFAGTVGSLILSEYQGGELVEVASCSGMTDAQRDEFWEAHVAGTLAGTVVEVAYFGRVGSGLRHPQFRRVRTDKTAEECIA